MKYDITKSSAPKMPTLRKGTECLQLILSQVSPDMHEAVVPMLFPALAAHVSETEFMYPDNTWKEMCGMLAHLIGESGMGKGQLTGCVEAVMQRFRKHDDEEMQKLVEWQRQVKTKGANKEKPVRPDVSFWFPPADVTNPAFIQNAMACEKAGGHTQYFNIPEVEMADRMCGGHKQVSQTIRNIYDRQKAGALRATADGVTGNPTMRVNMNLSSTPFSARKFYKADLFVGTFGRIPFSFKPRQERSGKIPRQGGYDVTFMESLDRYIDRLESCKGRFVVPQLNRLAEHLAADMATIADLSDDDVLWDMSKRAIVNAWKNGCILYILNAQVWTRGIGDMVEWMVYHDLWSKVQVFGDMLRMDDAVASESVTRRGPRNMLELLPDTFTLVQLEALRVSMGKPKEAIGQIRTWLNRKFITYSAQTGLYSKTTAPRRGSEK